MGPFVIALMYAFALYGQTPYTISYESAFFPECSFKTSDWLLYTLEYLEMNTNVLLCFPCT